MQRAVVRRHRTPDALAPFPPGATTGAPLAGGQRPPRATAAVVVWDTVTTPPWITLRC